METAESEISGQRLPDDFPEDTQQNSEEEEEEEEGEEDGEGEEDEGEDEDDEDNGFFETPTEPYKSSGTEEDEDEDDEDVENKGALESEENKGRDFFYVWRMSKFISRWKMAHQRGYHVSQLNSDPAYRAMFMQHELDLKTSIPLPLICMMEEEVLQILMETEKAYRHQLGASHPLTKQVQERIQHLRALVPCKHAVSEPQTKHSVLGTLWGWLTSLFNRLWWDTAGAEETENTSLPRHTARS